MVMDGAGAMLFGRRTHELMEAHWPQVARDPGGQARKPVRRPAARQARSRTAFTTRASSS